MTKEELIEKMKELAKPNIDEKVAKELGKQYASEFTGDTPKSRIFDKDQERILRAQIEHTADRH